ncbi:hypothetical protein A176_001629 [Myxococcus hansupus]|uniref:Knr4/Smi1-like domain-containing protein n=1 Tax=Pseudomyxococcus hansupus TaxID=1297742 RepID=A0A0H4XA03_9BACT|nr:hypothetical protein [Myxococcus hansupus]AKQ64717.1 hypothetical protein A176_001629 [Myxococcus hansupus]
MNYQQMFQSVKRQLSSAGARIVWEDCDAPLAERERRRFMENEALRLPDAWLEFFNELSGLAFIWRLIDPAGQSQLNGFFTFQDFRRFMENDTTDLLWCDWYEEDDIAEMKTHHILERFEGHDAYVTVKFKEDGSYDLFFVDGDLINHGGSKKLPRIPLTLRQYVEVVTGYWGVYSVRYHLHKQDFYVNPEKYIPELGELKALFPGFEPPTFNPFETQNPGT